MVKLRARQLQVELLLLALTQPPKKTAVSWIGPELSKLINSEIMSQMPIEESSSFLFADLGRRTLILT